jgi:hypothetical protein
VTGTFLNLERERNGKYVGTKAYIIGEETHQDGGELGKETLRARDLNKAKDTGITCNVVKVRRVRSAA